MNFTSYYYSGHEIICGYPRIGDSSPTDRPFSISGCGGFEKRPRLNSPLSKLKQKKWKNCPGK